MCPKDRERRGEKKSTLMDMLKERLDRHLLGLTGKADPASEPGLGLDGLMKLILTWELHYSDKDCHFDFSQSVLRKK